MSNYTIYPKNHVSLAIGLDAPCSENELQALIEELELCGFSAVVGVKRVHVKCHNATSLAMIPALCQSHFGGLSNA